MGLAATAAAQPTFQVVRVFDPQTLNPHGNLIQATDGMLYGTTQYGGGGAQTGSVYRMRLDGSGYSVLHTFIWQTEGNGPLAGLLQASNGKLYGTCSANGGNSNGTLWTMNLDGSGFTVLHAFSGGVTDGAQPKTTLLQATDGKIYGETYTGGAHSGGGSTGGTAFRMNLDGSGYTLLRSFNSATDGEIPEGIIQAANGFLYGTSYGGGLSGGGTLWRMALDGSGFVVIHAFAGLTDGGYVSTPPMQAADGRIYGTNTSGGPVPVGPSVLLDGVIWSVNDDGTAFATLFGFTSANFDSSPQAALFQAADGFLYGTVQSGGPNSFYGSLFRLNTNGSGFQTLRTFAYQTDGGNPYAPLLQATDGNLYSTLSQGGDNSQFQSTGVLYALYFSTAPSVTSSAAISGTYGTPFSYTITGTFSPNLFGVTGTLPPGLQLNSSTGSITGTPTQAGAFPITLTVTNGAGSGQLSATITIAKAPLTVTGNNASMTLGGVVPALSATVSGFVNGDSSAVVSGTAQVSTTATPASPAGNYPITPAQGTLSAANYTFTTFVPGTLTISSLLTQTITFPAIADQVLGAPAIVFSATASSGLPVSYLVNSGPASLAGSLLQQTGAGTVSVTASQAGNGSYAAAVPVTRSFQIQGVAPAFLLQPATQSATAGDDVTMNAAATGAPAPTFQWYRNGNAVAGATSPQLVLTSVTTAQAGTFVVRAVNAAGAAFSSPAVLTVSPALLQGSYFGKFILQLLGGASAGAARPHAALAPADIAVFVRSDGTGLMLIYASSTKKAYLAPITTDADGNFSAIASPTDGVGGSWSCHGRIVQGNLNATVDGQPGSTLSATADPANGGLAPALFTGTALGGLGATTYTITGGDGTAYALVTNGVSADGGAGTIKRDGSISITTSQGSVLTGHAGPGGQFVLQDNALFASSGAVAFLGLSDGMTASVALVNGSVRGQVGTGENVLVTGFVLAGGAGTKQVLIRAAGPGLGAFGLSSPVAQPVLTLYRGSVPLATNQGWGTGGGAAALAAAASGAGAFSFAPGSSDSALLADLGPGAYTVVTSGANGGTGIALAELYDVSHDASHFSNFSSRGLAGGGAQALIGGLVVAGNSPKRLLIRAVGPGLASFGIKGVLGLPQLQLMQGQTVVAQNSG